MKRLAMLAPAALLFAIAAQAQTLTVDPARTTDFDEPIPAHPGELIASDISDTDFNVGPEFNSEQFVFMGRKGEVVTAQVRSDIPTLEVAFKKKGYSGAVLVRGPAKDTPLRATLPEDGTYFLIVAAQGPQRIGKYLLSFGSDGNAPPFEKPKPPVQTAQTLAPSKIAPSAPLTAPKLPATPGVINIKTGQTLTRPAGKAGSRVEIFQFIAGAGTNLHIAANGTGPLDIRLYTPEGVEMLAADGTNAAKLDAVLPLDAVYFFSVARQNAAKPYKLALTADEPDIYQFSFARLAGYEILEGPSAGQWICWLEPGVKLQYNASNGSRSTLTVHAGGSGRWDYTVNGQPVSYTFTTRLEGNEFVRTSDSNAVQRWPLAPPSKHGAYRGYLCR
jgi:hypothetical protein